MNRTAEILVAQDAQLPSAAPMELFGSDPAQAALAALSRAGLRAADDARRANTHMVIEENGMKARRSICASAASNRRSQTPKAEPDDRARKVPCHRL